METNKSCDFEDEAIGNVYFLEKSLIEKKESEESGKRKIDARLRRESLNNPPVGQAKDFWLLYDAIHNTDIQISNPYIVSNLDEIYQNKNNERDLSSYLFEKGYLPGKRSLKSYWLPKVKDALSAPVKVFYNPSGKCPNKCLYCFVEGKHQYTLEDNVSKETARQIISLPIFWLNLGGCELAYYPLYFEFAKKAINNGIHVSSAFSGVGLNKNLVEKIRDLGIKAKISLDGPKRINDIQRPGTYESAVNAIELFRNANYPVRINVVHTRLNNDENIINEIFDIAEKHGALGIDFSCIRPRNDKIDNNLMIPFEDYKNGKVKKVLEKIENHPFTKSGRLLIHINKNMINKNNSAKPCQVLGVHCSGGRYSMGINMDGSIDGCYFLPKEFMPKSSVYNKELFLNKNYLLSIWQNDSGFKIVREFTNKKSCCPNCDTKKASLVKGCPANASYYNGIDPAIYLH